MSSIEIDNPGAKMKVLPWEQRTMACPRCGIPIEKEKADPKSKIYSSTGTKTPYCHFCWFEQWKNQNPNKLGV
jgi:hypothetical protein